MPLEDALAEGETEKAGQGCWPLTLAARSRPVGISATHQSDIDRLI